MANNIKIPIAKSRTTDKLLNIKDVQSGLKCNCYCDLCKGDLVAVNDEGNKQRPHFRHTAESNCAHNNSYESYIHWLTKEVFKEMSSISLPKIGVYSLRNESEDYKEFINEAKLFFKAYNILLEIPNESYLYSIVLQPQKEFKITTVKTEVTYNSKYGYIKVDIVLSMGEQEFFIEPFFTNPIDDFKFKKIVDKDVSTLSLNLRNFVSVNQHLFTIEEFKAYLANDLKSKSWEYVRREKIKALKKVFFDKLDKECNNYRNNHINNNKIRLKMEDKIKKRSELMLQIHHLNEEVDKLEKSIIPFPFDKLIDL